MSSPYLVVMAGGSGTRFWPKSTSKRPKQLLSFENIENAPSLLVQTVERFSGVVAPNNRMIVTTAQLEVAISNQVTSDIQILAEPQARNTAPCIYWAAREVFLRDQDAIMLVMPADHYIPETERFLQTVRRAIVWAEKYDDLVTLGVRPGRPETGYGYLMTGECMEEDDTPSACRRVEAFVEKPNRESAERFVSSGKYLWNAGMFVWQVRVILEAFDKHMPEMRKVWDEAHGDFQKAYPRMTATSIDYGIMEKAENVVTFPLECGWDDLGNWTSLESIADRIGAGCPGGVVTSGELLSIDSSGNIVDAPGKLVAVLGVDNLIIAESGNAILVAHKDRAQEIRKIVDEVKKRKPEYA